MKKILHFRVFLLIATFILINNGLLAQINFSSGSNYKYLKGNQAVTLPSTWINPGYSDATWSSGIAPFRYGDGSGGTELTDMQGNYTTLYLRSAFIASQVELLDDIVLTMNLDDGFVMWINGSEALRSNAPDVLSNTAIAPSTDMHEFDRTVNFTLKASNLNLIEGNNIVAVQVFNCSLSESTDLFFDFSMLAEVGTPELIDTIGLTFSEPSGFKQSTFNLTITSPDQLAKVIYTLDGSNPQNSTTADTAAITATINIDPASSAERGTTPAVVVRASIFKDGFRASKPESRTYIYIEKVKTQSYPGGDWPDYNVNGQTIDYPMDPVIVNDSRYINLIDDALLDIPSISVITDNKNLFDPTTGIYVNALNHGEEWEKECSVELIYPDGSEGFNVNAGLRIRGGYSRHGWYPKHAFRLFFRKEYGDAKLRYPLFGDEGVDEFDKIDLRCEQNYAWSNGDAWNSLVREVFSRDTQRDMDRPYTRSRYYHLYLNGLYYGVYQTQERSEARYAADYFGDDSEDYDVIKTNVEDGGIEATDGNTAGWQKVYNAINSDMAQNSNYYKLEGKDANGNIIKGAEVLVDIENLIDYMILIFYSGNFDAPVSAWGSNKSPNNFYAIDNRNDLSKGFIFFAHDAEHSLLSEAAGPGIGLYENRVNIGSISGDNQMIVYDFRMFQPQWLHFKLSQNAEYNLRFADRAYKHLQGDGALTPSKCVERMEKRVAEIETAVIAESARWGDMAGWTSFTKDDHWLPEINKLRNDYFPVRTAIVINQLKQSGLYSNLAPPIVKNSGSLIEGINYIITTATDISISNANTSGTVYYTIDGSDPRLIGGAVSSKALTAGSNFIMNIKASTLLKARVYDNGQWSALKHINFMASTEDYSNLMITELHYHPADHIVGTDTTDGKDLEFIEFKNIGETSINLSGLVLDSAVYYEYPNGVLIAPKQFWVVASKPGKFYTFYGKEPSGNFKGNFSNSGEEILLKDATDNPVIHFIYDDQYPWPEDADGDGYSMVSTYFNPTGNPTDASYWRASLKLYGSPFRDDDGLTGIENFEMLSGPNLKVYPNPSTDYIILSIKGSNLSDEFRVGIYSVSGSLVYQSELHNNEEIDLTVLNLQTGIYFLQVATSSYCETTKFVFQNKN